MILVMTTMSRFGPSTGKPAPGEGFVVRRQQVRLRAQRSALIPLLSAAIAIGAAISVLSGLFSQARPTLTTTTRGTVTELFGSGIYAYDSLFSGAGNRGTDAVTLVVALPLLAYSLWRLRAGSPRWHLFLTGVLTWFLYVYTTLAVGAAFNGLFLVYVAVVAASLWALVVAIAGLDFTWLAGLVDRLPRRGPAVFLLASGAFTVVVWCAPVLIAQLSADLPARLDGYTTMVTAAIDAAIVAPAALAAGTLFGAAGCPDSC